MDGPRATEIVGSVLATINEHRWRDLQVPHGFSVASLDSEKVVNPFAPTALSHWRVTAELEVPVLYSPDSSSGIARAALPASRENLEALRRWIEAQAAVAPARRVKLSDWRVTPDEAPAPYLETGEPNGPPASWTVVAVLDVD